MDALAGMKFGDSLRSWDARRNYEKRIRHNAWNEAAEANLRECFVEQADGTLKRRTPGRVMQAIVRDRARWEITKIQQPSLMIFANNPVAAQIQNLAPLAEDQLELLREASDEIERTRRGQIEAFRKNGKHVRIVEMADTDHRCFIHRERESMAAVDAFLRG